MEHALNIGFPQEIKRLWEVFGYLTPDDQNDCYQITYGDKRDEITKIKMAI